MTDAGWAEKKVEDLWFRGLQHVNDMSALLKAEHARSVRIVKAEIKRVKLSAYQYSPHEKAYILTSLDNVLTALQRGRRGGYHV